MPERKKQSLNIVDLALFHVSAGMEQMRIAVDLLQQEQALRGGIQERMQAVVDSLKNHGTKENKAEKPKRVRRKQNTTMPSEWHGTAIQFLTQERSVKDLKEHLRSAKGFSATKSEVDKFLKENLDNGILERISRGHYKVRPENNAAVDWHVAAMKLLGQSSKGVTTKTIRAKLNLLYNFDIPSKTISSFLLREMRSGNVKKITRGCYRKN